MHQAQLRVWEHNHVGHLDVINGVAREADPIVAVRPEVVRRLWPHMLLEDGTLQPDPVTRYRPLEAPVFPDGRVAYQRIDD